MTPQDGHYAAPARFLHASIFPSPASHRLSHARRFAKSAAGMMPAAPRRLPLALPHGSASPIDIISRVAAQPLRCFSIVSAEWLYRRDSEALASMLNIEAGADCSR